MKYLQDYVNEGHTKAFEKAGAFFAFGQEQFNEKKKDGVEYVSAGMGLLCPADTVQELLADLKLNYQNGIKQDIEENGIDAIIRRELMNHEAYYTYDLDDTANALKDYPVTMEDISKVFNDNKQINSQL